MDFELLLIILCVVVALFFMGRRFYRCLRKGQCSCGSEGEDKSACKGCKGPVNRP